MYTINFKGKPNPKKQELVKIEMILFKSDYPRVTKVINITGHYKDWDQNTQSFNGKTADCLNKNKQLLDVRMKYLKIVEDWENDGVDWTPVLWSHFFETKQGKKEKIKILSVLETIQTIEERFSKAERIKNGKLIIGSGNSDLYRALRNSLSEFTQEKYNRKFSTFHFEDIDSQFFEEYAFSLQKRGIKNGNKGSIVNNLKTLRSTLNHADKMKIPGVDTNAYIAVEKKMQRGIVTPKTIPYDYIKRIENIDRTKFTEKEQFHIDIYLFSFYAGGMGNVDICHLNWKSYRNNQFIYERMKTVKEAQMPVLDKALKIINKYKKQSYADYIFPIIKEQHKTDLQQRRRVSAFSSGVNKTLKKVAKIIKYKDKLTWYSARGSYITKMIDEGYHPEVVAEHAGNSPQVIYKHYYKVTNQEDMAKQLNSIF